MQARRHVSAPPKRELNRNRTDSLDLLELLDRSLDKGVLIDGRVRMPLLGIELLALDCRACVASLERYPEYAAAVTQTVDVRELHDGEDEHP